ncbi:MAG: class I SAM-dependent methyltransferase [Patescibacteria group bacterium]
MTVRQAVEASTAALGAIGERESSERLRIELTMKFVNRVAGGYEGKRVLELGSSLGLHLIAAKKLGASRVVGMDKYVFPEAGENAFYVSPEDMSVLRRAWTENGVEVMRGDLADPFPDGSFDLVVCNAVLEHVQGIHKHVFDEARRVLAPGGSFVLTTPNIASLLKRVRLLFGRSPNWDLKDFFDSGLEFTGHTREFTIAECRKMLEWSGFHPSAVMSKPSYFRWDWLWNPRKAHNVFFQLLSRLSSSLGDLIFAAGKKSANVIR